MNRRTVAWLAGAVLLVCAATAHAQAAPISRSARFIGNINFYRGGSGSSVDSSVILNDATIAANRTFTTTFNNGGTNFPFFAGPGRDLRQCQREPAGDQRL